MFSRRRVLTGSLGATLVPWLPEVGYAQTNDGGRRPLGEPTVETPDDLCVVTAAGKVRGYFSDGIATFKGIPYGDSRSRFRPPAAPPAWVGVRSCYSYGPICPQSPLGNGNDFGRFYSSTDKTFADEDCLTANVWTPGVTGTAHRPVLVWLHGGGFNSGSSHESVAYDGERLSRRGDVVVISVNHRLNALGFLNLAAYGPPYEHSANAGLLDLILALQWIRDTVDRFGGDPGNVTIMGQSGGGRKVSSLLAMPDAAGLFHKAIVQSGSLLTVGLAAQTGALADATLRQLNLDSSQLDRLAELSPATLIAAYDAACARLVTPSSDVFGPPYTVPTLDGAVIPRQPFDKSAPALSAHVPMLIGSCLHEQATGRSNPGVLDMTEPQLRSAVVRDYGASTDEVINVFRKAHPNVKPFELLALIQSVAPRRLSAVRQAELKAEQRAAAVFNYQFAWRTPIFDAAPLAHHGSELPFVFYNIDLCLHQTGGGRDARVMAARISDAWINFARSGNPNGASLPRWPSVTPGVLPTMIFDSTCEVRYDHDRAERRVATIVPQELRHL